MSLEGNSNVSTKNMPEKLKIDHRKRYRGAMKRLTEKLRELSGDDTLTARAVAKRVKSGDYETVKVYEEVIQEMRKEREVVFRVFKSVNKVV